MPNFELISKNFNILNKSLKREGIYDLINREISLSKDSLKIAEDTGHVSKELVETLSTFLMLDSIRNSINGLEELDENSIIYFPRQGEPLYSENVEYCVIIGKEITGGCNVTLCPGIEGCPYFKET